MRCNLNADEHCSVRSAAKAIKLAAALVSMLSLETAMLTRFDERKGSEFRQFMTGITGGCVCMIVLGIAFFMMIRSTKQLKSNNMAGY